MAITRKGLIEDATPTPRYYFNLKRKARNISVDLVDKEWCDMWHHHLDWSGIGDNGWLDRRRHLSALLIGLVCAKQELESAGIPHQLFASIHPNDSGSDAIYVHTANPNGTPFPIVHSGQEVHSLPPLLAGRLDLSHYRVLSFGADKSRSYIIEPLKVHMKNSNE